MELTFDKRAGVASLRLVGRDGGHKTARSVTARAPSASAGDEYMVFDFDSEKRLLSIEFLVPEQQLLPSVLSEAAPTGGSTPNLSTIHLRVSTSNLRREGYLDIRPWGASRLESKVALDVPLGEIRLGFDVQGRLLGLVLSSPHEQLHAETIAQATNGGGAPGWPMVMEAGGVARHRLSWLESLGYSLVETDTQSSILGLEYRGPNGRVRVSFDFFRHDASVRVSPPPAASYSDDAASRPVRLNDVLTARGLPAPPSFWTMKINTETQAVAAMCRYLDALRLIEHTELSGDWTALHH